VGRSSSPKRRCGHLEFHDVALARDHASDPSSNTIAGPNVAWNPCGHATPSRLPSGARSHATSLEAESPSTPACRSRAGQREERAPRQQLLPHASPPHGGTRRREECDCGLRTRQASEATTHGAHDSPKARAGAACSDPDRAWTGAYSARGPFQTTARRTRKRQKDGLMRGFPADSPICEPFLSSGWPLHSSGRPGERGSQAAMSLRRRPFGRAPLAQVNCPG
jgi:hypothetical protein